MLVVLPSTWKVYYVPLLQSEIIYRYKKIQNLCILWYEGYILLMNSKSINICSIGKIIPYKRPTSPIHLYTLLWMKHGLSNWFILRSAFWGLPVLLKILYVWFLTLKTSSLTLPLTDEHRCEPKKDLMTFRTGILQNENLQNCYSPSYAVVWDMYIQEVNKKMIIKYWLED